MLHTTHDLHAWCYAFMHACMCICACMHWALLYFIQILCNALVFIVCGMWFFLYLFDSPFSSSLSSSSFSSSSSSSSSGSSASSLPSLSSDSSHNATKQLNFTESVNSTANATQQLYFTDLANSTANATQPLNWTHLANSSEIIMNFSLSGTPSRSIVCDKNFYEILNGTISCSACPDAATAPQGQPFYIFICDHVDAAETNHIQACLVLADAGRQPWWMVHVLVWLLQTASMDNQACLWSDAILYFVHLAYCDFAKSTESLRRSSRGNVMHKCPWELLKFPFILEFAVGV